jgi:hypothetical protein
VLRGFYDSNQPGRQGVPRTGGAQLENRFIEGRVWCRVFQREAVGVAHWGLAMAHPGSECYGDVTTAEILSRLLHPVNAFEFNELNFGVGVSTRRGAL